jgi:hypothetical protein
MKFFKIILKILFSVVLLIAISVAGYFAWKTYNFYFWTPPEKLDGIHLGMSRSDIFFTQGSDVEYHPKENYKTAERIAIAKKPFSSYSDDEKIQSATIFFDKEDKVHTIALSNLDIRNRWNIQIPFKNTEDLISAFGEPDLLAISEDDSVRRYTYVEKGITFAYAHDKLISIMIGEVTWRSYSEHNQKYYIYGKKICPSKQCPWSDGGVLKEEFKDRDFTYFLRDK